MIAAARGSGCEAPAPGGLSSLAGRGEPLPSTWRASAAARLGGSFDDVRVHRDEHAHRLAKDAGARAFTWGSDIVFGAGQYVPGTTFGDALLWHELSHAAAPRADPAWIHRAPRYDTTNWTIPTPDRVHTVKSMQAAVDGKIKKTPADITSATVVGTNTDEEKLFLLHVLYQLGSRDRWDSVIRLWTAIGWTTKANPIVPTGYVDVTIDAAGNAKAELVLRGPGTPRALLAEADAITKLQSDYGIANVAAGDKAWTPGELSDVVAALARIPAADRAALKGVDLLRFTTLPEGHAGEFSTGGTSIAQGATQVTVLARPTLKLADSAFPVTHTSVGDARKASHTGNVNPMPSSFLVILHEVGHAVEAQAARAASDAVNLAVIRQNKAYQAEQRARAELTAAKASGADTAPIVERIRKHVADNKAAAADVAAKRKAQAKTRVGDTVTKPLETDAATKATTQKAAVTAAVSAAGAYSPKDQGDSAAYQAAVDGVEKAIATFAKDAAVKGADVGALEKTLLAAVKVRDDAREALKKAAPASPALKDFAAVETAQDERIHAERMLANTRGRTARLQKFVDVVNQNNIVPMTQYARDKWPYRPQELYAESYALWLTEPDFLRSNYKPIFDFFDSGEYAK